MTPTMQGRKLRSIRLRNHKAVINALRRERTLSIGNIAQRINLSTTAVSKIVGNLLEKEMLSMEGKGHSTNEGGKRPELYTINASYRYGIVINAEPPSIIDCYVYDLALHQLAAIHRRVSMQSYEDTVHSMAKILREAMNTVDGLTPETLCGIALPFPGLIDSEDGEVAYSIHTPHWGTNLPLCDDLKRELGFDTEIVLENNCRFSGYGELYEPEHENLSSYVTIAHLINRSTAVEGTGGCVVINRQLLRGAHSFIGEFGHVTMREDDPELCNCGRHGCFQMMTACSRVIASARAMIGEYPRSALAPSISRGGPSMEEIFEASNDGDPLACTLMDRVAFYYARLIEHVILSQDPDRVIIQGIYSTAGDYFLSRVHSHLADRAIFGVSRENLVVCTSHPFCEQVPLGAALYLFDSFFNQDLLYD